MKVSDLIETLKEDGWVLSRTKGSHRQFKHSNKKVLSLCLVNYLMMLEKVL